MRSLIASLFAVLLLLAVMSVASHVDSATARDEANTPAVVVDDGTETDDGTEATEADGDSEADGAAAEASGDEGDSEGVTSTAPWSRIAVIGASASDGFGARMDFLYEDKPVRRRVTLSRIFETITEGDVVAAHASSMFFLNPMTVGRNQLERALDASPTVIVAIDWLFWYGYGSLDRDGNRLRDESQRLELLEAALAMLEPVECTLVLGDYPDMSPAVGGMLSRAQMPAAETLDALNTRLRAWAAERDNVVVVSMASLIDNVRNGVGFTIERSAEAFDVPDNAESVLLQSDQLHPSVDGMIAIAQAAMAAAEQTSGVAWPLPVRQESILASMIARWIKAMPTPGP